MDNGLAPSNTAKKVTFISGTTILLLLTSLCSRLIRLNLPGASSHPIHLYFNMSQCQSFLPSAFAFNLYFQILNTIIIINL